MIHLPEPLKNRIIQHAEQTYPEECCGFIFGLEQSGERSASEVMPGENRQTENRERRFMIAPREYLKAERYGEENDLQLIGIYHSHPDHPAQPSQHDQQQAMPWFSYVIVSIEDGSYKEMTSWWLDDDRNFFQEEIRSNPQHQTDS